MNIRKSSQKPMSNICFYFFSLADVLRTTDLSSLSSLEDFLKLFKILHHFPEIMEYNENISKLVLYIILLYGVLDINYFLHIHYVAY